MMQPAVCILAHHTYTQCPASNVQWGCGLWTVEHEGANVKGRMWKRAICSGGDDAGGGAGF